jgi:hypothetical protein
MAIYLTLHHLPELSALSKAERRLVWKQCSRGAYWRWQVWMGIACSAICTAACSLIASAVVQRPDIASVEKLCGLALGLIIGSVIGTIVYLQIWIAVLRDSLKAELPAVCHNCGYRLTGNLSGVCPECGRAKSQTIQT